MSHFWNQVWVKLFVALSKAHIPISCYLFSQQGMFAYSLPCCGTVCGISLWYIYSSCFFSSVVLWQFDSRIALKCLRSVSSVFIRSIYGRYLFFAIRRNEPFEQVLWSVITWKVILHHHSHLCSMFNADSIFQKKENVHIKETESGASPPAPSSPRVRPAAGPACVEQDGMSIRG